MENNSWELLVNLVNRANKNVLFALQYRETYYIFCYLHSNFFYFSAPNAKCLINNSQFWWAQAALEIAKWNINKNKWIIQRIYAYSLRKSGRERNLTKYLTRRQLIFLFFIRLTAAAVKKNNYSSVYDLTYSQCRGEAFGVDKALQVNVIQRITFVLREYQQKTLARWVKEETKLDTSWTQRERTILRLTKAYAINTERREKKKQ